MDGNGIQDPRRKRREYRPRHPGRPSLATVLLVLGVGLLTFLGYHGWRWHRLLAPERPLIREAERAAGPLPAPPPIITSVVVSRSGAWAAFMPRAAGGGDPECIGLADLAPGGKARWVQAGLAVHPGLTWSPDEGSLALSCSGRRTRRDQLAVYDVGLGTVRLLKSGLRGETIVAPSWSPTGEWIAFLRLGRTCALWLVRPDGSEERRVPTTGDVSVGTPRWSPDGKELYYLAEHPSEGAVVRDAFVARVSAPGGQCEALTHALRPHEMWLSPDGQYLLCHVACGARSADLYHLVPTATSARIHAVVLPFAAPGAAIAPDSKRIVFLDRVRTPGQDLRRPFSVGGDVFFMAEERYRLRAVPVAGGQGDQIIGDASGLAWDNAWTAQHQIVFTRDDNTSLWVADDDGTHERKVSGLE